jgi:hypothetical protein
MSQIIRALNGQTVRCSECGCLTYKARFYPYTERVVCASCEEAERHAPVNLDLHPDRPLDEEPGVPF